MSEKNGNYEILHSINLNGEYGIVLGENKDAIEATIKDIILAIKNRLM